MPGLTEKLIEKMDELSIDEVLRCLIEDTDLIEVACCLDQIAKETGRRVVLNHGDDQEYPAESTQWAAGA